MAGISSLVLNSSARDQLAQLKALNSVPLNRLDKSMSALRSRQPVLETVKTDVADLKTALQKVRDAPAADKPDAIKQFVSEFNTLQKQLVSTTGKDGVLKSISGVRDARTALRTPLSDSTVLAALADAGVKTTRDGLDASGTYTVDLSTAVIDKLAASVDGISARLASADSQLTSQLDRLTKEKTRAQVSVDRANTRTEKSFMQYYQMMQQMQSTSTSSAMSFFA